MKKLIPLFLFLFGCSGADPSQLFSDAGTLQEASCDAGTDASDEADVAPPHILDASFDSGQFDLGIPITLPMRYLGGSVVAGPANVYFIWYGNWTDTKTAPILEDMMRNVGNSAWFQTNANYWEQFDVPADGGTDAMVPGPKFYVSGQVNFIQSVYVGYSEGSSDLVELDLQNVVQDVISRGQLPYDPSGVYYVLTSSDVSVKGFCSKFCGWHDNFNMQGQNVRMVFIGDTASCPNGCSLQPDYQDAGFPNSPNGDWSADGMASILLHELAETVTDPDPNIQSGWRDLFGFENADKCAWTFGQPYETSNYSIANVPIGTRDFMIQQNWIMDTDGGHCGLHP